jgi:hypothetical protein
VLFALAVDRAVMRADQRALERTYLAGLTEDFVAAEDAVSFMMSTAARRDTAASLVLATIRRGAPGDLDGMELARALELAGFVIDVPVARDTWDDLIATGRLEILRNASLRREITVFYRRADELHGYSAEWIDMARRYGDAARGMLDPEVRVALGSELIKLETEPGGVTWPDAGALARRMASEPALLSAMGDVMLINKLSAIAYTEQAERARRILTMLGEEQGVEGS